MLTIPKTSTLEMDGKLLEGETVCIAVPVNRFEGMFLRKFMIRKLESDFAIFNLKKIAVEKTNRGLKQRHKLFSPFCASLWYDEWGRFFFDPHHTRLYQDGMISLFAVVSSFRTKDQNMEFGAECREMLDQMEEDDDIDISDFALSEQPEDPKIVYDFDVYAQEGGVLFETDDLVPKILKKAKEVTVKKS